MLRSLVSIAVAAAGAGLAVGFATSREAASFPDPIGPAERGMMQCHQPNPERRTCNSMAAYARAKGGGFDNTAYVLVRGPAPTVVMKTTTRVEIRDGAVCGRIVAADIEAAQFLIDDRVPTARQEQALRKAMLLSTSGLRDNEICTSYGGTADRLVSSVVVDGIPKPSANQEVVWVAPSEGYRVAP